MTIRRSLALTILLLPVITAWAGSAPDTGAQGAAAPAESAQPQQAAPVVTEPEPNRDPLATLQALSGYLSPADMNELSMYLWALVIDVLRGTQDATLPPDLAFKLAVLEQRFKKEGDAYLQQSLRNLDRDLKRFFQERLPAPPPLLAPAPTSAPAQNSRARNGN